MAYKIMETERIYEVFRRWQAGLSKSSISQAVDLDRKTISSYIKQFKGNGLRQDTKYSRLDALNIIEKIKQQRNARKGKNPCLELMPFKNDIKSMIHDSKNSMKAKTVFEYLQEKYNIKCSYTTYKRFIRSENLDKKNNSGTFRIETPPGLEVQIDYGKVGRFRDSQGKNRDVYAFCGILSFSRLPYIEFVFKQNTESFVDSNINMWEFYGGVTETQNLDNLKAGVIKPSLYDPILNKSYSEAIDHYDTFADPSRVKKPKDKGKIERFIQVARERFRYLKKLHPEEQLSFLNKAAQEWCKTIYGLRKHGTTGVEPMTLFEEYERDKLKRLPSERFEIPKWGAAKVHPDQFIQFEKKRYSLPQKYCGITVWVRRTGKFVRIFHNNQFIKAYIVPENHYVFDKYDFAEHGRLMMERGLPAYIISESQKINDQVFELIKKVLTPHANLNARNAQGMLTEIKKHLDYGGLNQVIQTALDLRVRSCRQLKVLFEEDKRLVQFKNQNVICSSLGEEMTRDIIYYLS